MARQGRDQYDSNRCPSVAYTSHRRRRPPHGVSTVQWPLFGCYIINVSYGCVVYICVVVRYIFAATATADQIVLIARPAASRTARYFSLPLLPLPPARPPCWPGCLFYWCSFCLFLTVLLETDYLKICWASLRQLFIVGGHMDGDINLTLVLRSLW